MSTKSRSSLKPQKDISKKNSFAAYAIQHADELAQLEKTQSKEKLIDFVKGAKEEGFSISDQKEQEYLNKIEKLSFIKGYQMIYNIILSGSGERVIKDSVEKKHEKMLKEDSEYQKFFKEKLKKWNVKSPAELNDEDKKKFFNEIEKEWKAVNESFKKKIKKIVKEELQKLIKEEAAWIPLKSKDRKFELEYHLIQRKPGVQVKEFKITKGNYPGDDVIIKILDGTFGGDVKFNKSTNYGIAKLYID